MNAYRQPAGLRRDVPSEAFLRAKAAANGELPPLTHAEKVAHWCKWLEIRAEDDRKREAQPQLELQP